LHLIAPPHQVRVRCEDGIVLRLIASLIAPDCLPHQVRVRCEDGTVLRLTLRAADPLSMIASAVEAQRPEGAGPFVLRVPFPSREYASVEELSTTSVRNAPHAECMLIAC
jgi:uncharacterized protein YwbE